MTTLVRLAEETPVDEGFPPIGWGLGAFAILATLMIIVLIFGRGRPHA